MKVQIMRAGYFAAEPALREPYICKTLIPNTSPMESPEFIWTISLMPLLCWKMRQVQSRSNHGEKDFQNARALIVAVPDFKIHPPVQE